MTVDEVEGYLYYLQHVRAYSKHTLRAYRYDLEQWCQFLAEQSGNISVVSVALARSYVSSLRRSQNKHNLSNRSINRRISTLKSFYRYLERNSQHMSNAESSNPWQSISLLPEEQRLPNYLSPEELQKLAAACKQAFPSCYLQQLCSAVLELGFSTGARVSELCSLDFSQIVSGAEIRSKLCIVGKGGKQRFVFLGEHSRGALAAYLSVRARFVQEKGLETHQNKRHEPLFYNSRGHRLQPRSVYALLARLGSVAGLQRPVHPHLLRHSFATTLLNHGVGIRSVQELLGHSSLSSTQIYTHVGIQHLREVYRKAHPHSKKL